MINRHLFNASAVLLIAAIAGCGGGGGGEEVSRTEPTTFPSTYLAKYQGTRYQKCATQIEFGTGTGAVTFGPPSVRERLVVSAPDVSGQVSMSLIEEFFDSTLSCYDYTSTPYASVQTSVPANGRMSRVETLSVGGISNAAQDILLVTEPGSPVTATGNGVTQVAVNGTSYWRITFSNGRFVDRPVVETADAGEVALLLVTVNGISGAELIFNGDLQNSFARP